MKVKISDAICHTFEKLQKPENLRVHLQLILQLQTELSLHVKTVKDQYSHFHQFPVCVQISIYSFLEVNDIHRGFFISKCWHTALSCSLAQSLLGIIVRRARYLIENIPSGFACLHLAITSFTGWKMHNPSPFSIKAEKKWNRSRRTPIWLP